MKYQTRLCVVCTAPILALAVGGCDRKTETPKPAAEVITPATVATIAPAQHPASETAEIERGRYLVTVGGCNDCHTTKKLGPKGPELVQAKLLAGHPADEKLPAAPAPSGAWMVATTPSLTAWSGPWGTSYAANLTPDKKTGLGNWTEAQFKQALKSGKHRGGAHNRDILPPMPWFNYAGMTDADFKAVFAYLRSIPAVSNAVPAPITSSPPTKAGAH